MPDLRDNILTTDTNYFKLLPRNVVKAFLFVSGVNLRWALIAVFLFLAHTGYGQADSDFLKWPIVFEGRVASIEKLKTYTYYTPDHQLRTKKKNTHHRHYLIIFTETKVLKKDYNFDDRLQEFSTDPAAGGFKFQTGHKYFVYATVVDGMPYPVKVMEMKK